MISRDRFVSVLMQRKGPILALFMGLLVPLLVFGKVADDILDNKPLGFDRPIQLWARSWHSPALDHWMLTLSAFGSPPLMFTLCAVTLGVLLYLRRRGDALFFFFSIGGAALLNVVAKAFFGRARPELWTSIDPRADYSFPSGHAMGTMAVFAALAFIAWGARGSRVFAVTCALLVLMVGLSRVYIGVHYPSDVFCGWLASFAWVFGLHWLRQSRRYSTRPSSGSASGGHPEIHRT
jgi:undecaprenyl-diphosphatase